jgi:spore maturation protein CgeB
MEAHNSNDYFNKFRWLLSNPEEANKMAINALKEVYTNHTSFHRAENFYIQLQNLIK